MKKIFLLLAAVLSLYMTSQAQEKKVPYEGKGFLIISAGPSLPLGDFKAKNLDNESAGFARTGINIDLQGGYHFTRYFALGGSIFYSVYSFDEMKVKELLEKEGLTGVSFEADHWKYYGVVAGPIFTWDPSERVFFDFHAMTGITRANSPKGSGNFDGISGEVSQDWSTAIPLRLGAGLRYKFTSNGYLFIGGNYFYINPEIKYKSTTGEILDRAHQRMSTLNLLGGIGFSF